MIQKGHLKVYDMLLETKGPLFIGSGRRYTKKEYCFDPSTKKAIFLDMEKFMNKVVEYGLMDQYEHFMLFRDSAYLHDFIRECGFSDADLEKMKLYETYVGDALVENRSLMEIQEFVHDAQNRPYVPGSSLKGALRTALLIKMILQDQDKPTVTSIRRHDADSIETRYLHTLGLTQKTRNAVNSVMRGIMISDSLPIDRSDMVLARKDDLSVSGVRKSINMIRESVKPGVKLHFKLTLDTSVLKAIDIDDIRDAISQFGRFYRETYIPMFRLPQNAVQEDFSDCLVLGGGSGYFAKNIIYPLCGKQEGLRLVSEFMTQTFRNHKHHEDVKLGASPHRLKHTNYHGHSYHFGVCKVLEIS
ncbi:MAG TPA: type III-A CRISPR-associated RAMP protein Csm5 [Thermoclostridium caenicola]|uniref:type III-A CRISPR-associated RAMP protein Csm5 n=1 Tax=Thermoclostridium caenicola TaxID=659425 RepID=UPI002C5A255F|nr:type III-A CRISPR-associated RAMP protein Csm5 [Thermoclostridium caenicola]HOL84275.1 type III-A CRISPR-associated RAMP protein Csm5 [Thermoclostridium caenicola]HPO76256.1 type III-A CRISPR-associated RAMP protein Csm5 [Thermoclostridium caenicola]